MRRLDQKVIIPRLLNPFRMICIAIAAKRMPTTRDMTVEIVKLINFDPQAAMYSINADSSTAKNIEPMFSKNTSVS